MTASPPPSSAPETNHAASLAATPCFIGIDIAKATFVTRLIPVRETRTWDNTPEGIAAAVLWMLSLAPRRIVLEATGGYERELLLAMLDAELPAVSINPRQSHHARQMMNRLDKTDAADADVLAWMAEHMQLPLTARPPEKLLKLRDLVARRGQLVKMRTAELNRRQMAKQPAERQSIDRVLQFLEREVKKLETEIAKLIEADDDWRAAARLLQSTPGVGPATSHTLIAELPELGTAKREEISALSGLAPRADQSGPYDGPRHIRGGRLVVRSALYMATLSAIRYNPVIKSYYIHLKQLGKKSKVAITACMRKLGLILHSLLKTGQLWRNMLEPVAASLPGTPEKG